MSPSDVNLFIISCGVSPMHLTPYSPRFEPHLPPPCLLPRWDWKTERQRPFQRFVSADTKEKVDTRSLNYCLFTCARLLASLPGTFWNLEQLIEGLQGRGYSPLSAPGIEDAAATLGGM